MQQALKYHLFPRQEEKNYLYANVVSDYFYVFKRKRRKKRTKKLDLPTKKRSLKRTMRRRTVTL
jgi:hypothetical protein